MLEQIPRESLDDGDVILTNDPWIGTGHVYDVNVVKPIFFNGRIVGYCLTVSHLSDVGGSGMGSGARDVFEEGFSLPPVKLFEAGKPSAFVFEFLRRNVRMPDLVLGHLLQRRLLQCSARGIIELLDEHGLDDTHAVAEAIYEQTRKPFSPS